MQAILHHVRQPVSVSPHHCLNPCLQPSRPHSLLHAQILQWVKSDRAVVELQAYGIHLVGEEGSTRDEGDLDTAVPSLVVGRLMGEAEDCGCPSLGNSPGLH